MQTASNSASATTLAPVTAASGLVLSTVRRCIMECMKADVFTEVERLRANDSVYQCQDEARLWLWLRNVGRVYAERKAAAATKPVSQEQQAEILRLCSNEAITQYEASALLLQLPCMSQKQAEAATEALSTAIWERDKGEAASLSELAGMLNKAGITHNNLLVA